MPPFVLEDPGEVMQKLGEDGARRAKLWLDATTRVESSWSVYDEFGLPKLKYPWPHGGKGFSYDLGGVLHGGDVDKQMFVAECKKYSTDQQGGHFDKFLAQSYVMRDNFHMMSDHIMWITWHPFRVKTWTKLFSEEKIEEALVAHGERVFGTDDKDEIVQAMNPDVVSDLAARIWVIVLSDRQETLLISPEDRGIVNQHRTVSEAQ